MFIYMKRKTKQITKKSTFAHLIPLQFLFNLEYTFILKRENKNSYWAQEHFPRHSVVDSC